MTQTTDDLLRHRHLRRAADGPGNDRRTATGFSALDAELASAGWPEDGLTEIISDAADVGELHILLPTLAALSQRKPRWIAWVGAPHLPYAPTLATAGVDTNRILLVHTKNHRDQLWATEQALRSGTCSAVLSWPDPNHLRYADLCRLQIAAREGSSWGVLFRPKSAIATASPAELRLLIDPWDSDAGTLALRVLKRRGGWRTEGVGIEFEDVLTQRMAASGQIAALRQLALWKPTHGTPLAATRRPGILAAITATARRRSAGRRSTPEPRAPGVPHRPGNITALPHRKHPEASGLPIQH